jgi:hypothetical protein
MGLDCRQKMQLLTHSPLTQGCLLYTLNESFSQPVPDQDDLLILKTLCLPQDRIHQKHKYFLFLETEDPSISTLFYTREMYGLSRNEGKEEKIL